QGQYKRVKEEIDGAVLKVLEHGQFINGPEVSEFALKLSHYLKTKHTITCANGTDALQIATMALDLKPGDEVITAAFTYVATAEVIALLGLTPVLVEVDPIHFTIDPASIERAITPKTKAIVPVHLFGQVSPMQEIMTIAKKYNLFVIEDNAQAIGAEYIFPNGDRKAAGTIGHIGTTSFFPSKNLGCYGDGGALTTNDDLLAEKIKMIANHGQRVKYVHDVIGVNSRLDTLQAAILNVKLNYLNDYVTRRQAVARAYDQGLKSVKGLILPATSTYSTHVFHQYTLTVLEGKRNALKKHLESQGIPTMIYYPIPLHAQKAFESNQYPVGSLPICEELAESVLSLPIHTEMKLEEIDKVVQSVVDFFI
ncbi:MAG: DegT/DnrJ/EryC1/StrS family aminotransferase, partial [Bacteroidota bacterium]